MGTEFGLYSYEHAPILGAFSYATIDVWGVYSFREFILYGTSYDCNYTR
jgi:hypothetical protein